MELLKQRIMELHFQGLPFAVTYRTVLGHRQTVVAWGVSGLSVDGKCVQLTGPVPLPEFYWDQIEDVQEIKPL